MNVHPSEGSWRNWVRPYRTDTFPHGVLRWAQMTVVTPANRDLEDALREVGYRPYDEVQALQRKYWPKAVDKPNPVHDNAGAEGNPPNGVKHEKPRPEY